MSKSIDWLVPQSIEFQVHELFVDQSSMLVELELELDAARIRSARRLTACHRLRTLDILVLTRGARHIGVVLEG